MIFWKKITIVQLTASIMLLNFAKPCREIRRKLSSRKYAVPHGKKDSWQFINRKKTIDRFPVLVTRWWALSHSKQTTSAHAACTATRVSIIIYLRTCFHCFRKSYFVI